MMKTKSRLLMAALAVCMLMVLSGSANADPLVLSLTNPNQVGTVGSVLSFDGTLSNLGAPAVTVFASQHTFNDGGGTLLWDDTGFAVNFLGQVINPTASLGPLEMFTVEILAGAAPGVYNGVFSVEYDNGSGIIETNLFSFSVTVQAPGEVPEPASLLLLGSGLTGLAAYARRRRQRGKVSEA